METRINFLEKGQNAIKTLLSYWKLFGKITTWKASFRSGMISGFLKSMAVPFASICIQKICVQQEKASNAFIHWMPGVKRLFIPTGNVLHLHGQRL